LNALYKEYRHLGCNTIQFEESMFWWNLILLPPSTDFLLGLFFKLEDEGNMRNLSLLPASFSS
jgi:hypothetical protein